MKKHLGRDKDHRNFTGEDRIQYALDQLEEGFAKDIEWHTELAPNLTLEEVIGALITAEQKVERLENLVKESDDIDNIRIQNV